jgi:Flp pilus assembly protein TadG
MLRSLISAIPLRAFLGDRRANVMVMFAGMGFGLVLMVGAGVDYSRATQFKTALQNAADSAALAGASVYVSTTTDTDGSTAAQNYYTAAKPKLPPYASVDSTATVATSSDANGYYVAVTINGAIKTTFLSLITNTINVKVYAKAKDPIVTANFNFGGWTSDAGDGNSIYWYMVKKDTSIPDFTAANISNHTYNLLFSNVADTSTIDLSPKIAASQAIAFAFVNQTAAHSPGWQYTNQYGGSTGTTHIFYSQFANPNAASSTTAPYGYGYTGTTGYAGGIVKNCSLQVRTYTGTAPTDPNSTGSCFTPPSQANISPYFSPSCASLAGGQVHYSWNDMGGGSDDMDYNDGQYNFSCAGGGTTTGVILTD